MILITGGTGLVGSQILPGILGSNYVFLSEIVTFLTMTGLAFIMIHVGYEFEINKKVIDRAIEMEMPYVSFIWHPWSLHQFDPAMNAVESTFQYVKDIGMEFSTFGREWKRAAEL